MKKHISTILPVLFLLFLLLSACGSVSRAPTEGVYLSGDRMIGEQIVQDGYISVILHDLAGIYAIEISNGEDWATQNVHISDLNPIITLEIAGQEPILINELETCYYRAPTGIWYYGFTLDHGVFPVF